jgi:hypothetical protein
MKAVAILAGPLVWLACLTLGYALVPWACVTGRSFVIHLVMLAGFVVAAATAFLGWRAWHIGGAGSATEEAAPTGRHRFLALVGIGMGAVSALVLLANEIVTVILGPCA